MGAGPYIRQRSSWGRQRGQAGWGVGRPRTAKHALRPGRPTRLTRRFRGRSDGMERISRPYGRSQLRCHAGSRPGQLRWSLFTLLRMGAIFIEVNRGRVRALARACDFLRETLAGGPRRTSEVKELAKVSGVSQRALEAARAVLDIQPVRLRARDGTHFWAMQLPRPKPDPPAWMKEAAALLKEAEETK